jgi:hypothetical protein
MWLVPAGQVPYQLKKECYGDEGEADLSEMPPKPTVVAESKLEVIRPKASGEVARVNEREKASEESEAKRGKSHTPNMSIMPSISTPIQSKQSGYGYGKFTVTVQRKRQTDGQRLAAAIG